MNEEIVSVSGVYFSYNGDFVLENVNLKVKEKDFLMIVGPNGGGKTTLVKMLLGILKPAKGEVKVFGTSPENVLDKIGYVPQKMNNVNDMPLTVLECVLTGLKSGFFKIRYTKNEIKKAEYVLSRVEMDKFKDKKMSELSGGQVQRVYLARALISSPELLILDEPTSNIDPYGSFCFFTTLEEINKEKTIIMVTHNLNLLATKINSVACVNKYLLYNDKPELTKEMMEIMYGIHDEHYCSMGAYVAEEIKHLTKCGGENCCHYKGRI
jgi:zinc transport system ATP-binding protein